ncbi:MAG: SIMPL domain-containing protein [Clostridia bacterium]|nr:SIMPL domain-containing protein [Clostridia bacterium]
MHKLITVKGTGKISLSPDTTEVTMTLKTLDKIYEKSMSQSAEILESLKSALVAIGFDEKALKTTNFNVFSEYDSVQDENGMYQRVFKGYSCVHMLKLEFDFDTDKLSQTLTAISNCIAEPELNIQFTVKDKDSATDEILKNAATNARHKAEILAATSKVKLGKLVSIDYNWGDVNFYSNTTYGMERKCMMAADNAGMSINPDNIEISDDVTFVWEID